MTRSEDGLYSESRQGSFALAQGAIFASTIHIAGASFTIASHIGQHGLLFTSELETVGLAVLALSAALSFLSLWTSVRMLLAGLSRQDRPDQRTACDRIEK